mmetsp:Transcript_22862/g.36696  ORF Transcript_22862/g.36696 Transcript_22862/m.36696 type:complete len:254 (+) Transcript_22862:233-994(+)
MCKNESRRLGSASTVQWRKQKIEKLKCGSILRVNLTPSIYGQIYSRLPQGLDVCKGAMRERRRSRLSKPLILTTQKAAAQMGTRILNSWKIGGLRSRNRRYRRRSRPRKKERRIRKIDDKRVLQEILRLPQTTIEAPTSNSKTLRFGKQAKLRDHLHHNLRHVRSSRTTLTSTSSLLRIQRRHPPSRLFLQKMLLTRNRLFRQMFRAYPLPPAFLILQHQTQIYHPPHLKCRSPLFQMEAGRKTLFLLPQMHH